MANTLAGLVDPSESGTRAQNGENREGTRLAGTAASSSSSGSCSQDKKHTAATEEATGRQGTTGTESKTSDAGSSEIRWTAGDYEQLNDIERELTRDWKPQGVVEEEEISKIAYLVFWQQRKGKCHAGEIEEILMRLERFQQQRRRMKYRWLCERMLEPKQAGRNRRCKATK